MLFGYTGSGGQWAKVMVVDEQPGGEIGGRGSIAVETFVTQRPAPSSFPTRDR
jgi:hypothetical protein